MALDVGKTIVIAVLLMCITKVSANQGKPCAGVMSGTKNDFTDCRTYFRCVDGMEYHEKCPIGRYYDEERNKCGPEEDVECLRCPASGYLIYRHTDSCSALTMCENGIAHDSNCKPGSYFHEHTRSCFDSRKVVCHICPPTGVKIVHNTSDCKKFNICNNGVVAGTFDCSSDSYFDRNIKSCVVAEFCPPTSTKPLD